uniref:CHAT domain-containing protein n=1 Tax=Parerythrobacter lutipelagi TaxID=1964208 RepID=UPI0010F6CCCA|nr:CHAT domain-containing protein [Parerythrobacter lutipelagi]
MHRTVFLAASVFALAISTAPQRASANPENASEWYGATDEDRLADFERILLTTGSENNYGEFNFAHTTGAGRIYQLVELVRAAEDPEVLLSSDIFAFLIGGSPAAESDVSVQIAYRELLKLSLANCSRTTFQLGCLRRFPAYAEMLYLDNNPEEVRTLLSNVPLPDDATIKSQPEIMGTLSKLQNEMKFAGLHGQRVKILEQLAKPTYAGNSESEKASVDLFLANALLDADRAADAVRRLKKRDVDNELLLRETRRVRATALTADGKGKQALAELKPLLDEVDQLSSTQRAEIFVLAASAEIARGDLDAGRKRLEQACQQYSAPNQPCDQRQISDQYLLAWSDLHLATGDTEKAEARILKSVQGRASPPEAFLRQLDKIPGGADRSIVNGPLQERSRRAAVSNFKSLYPDFRFHEARLQAEERRHSEERIEQVLLAGFKREWLGDFSDYEVDVMWKKLALTRFADGDSETALKYYENYLSGSPNYSRNCEAAAWFYQFGDLQKLSSQPGIAGCESPEMAEREANAFWLQIALHGGRDEDLRSLARSKVIEAFVVKETEAAQYISEKAKPLYSGMLHVAFPQSDDPDPLPHADWVYQVMQIVMANETARNIAISEANRQAETISPRAAELAKQYQRYFDRLNNVEEVQPGLFFPRSSLMDYDEQRAREKQIRADLEAEFPAYFDLIEVRPMSLEDTAATLQADEAVLHILPSQNGTLVAYADAEGVRFHRGEWSADEVQRAVQRLRWSMGADVGAPQEVVFRWTDETPDATSLPFPTALAHDLYREILAPFEERLRSRKNVFVVADGAIASLPLHVLLAKPHQSSDWQPSDLRDAPWVADEPYALIQLPSVQTLSILRQRARREGRSTSATPSFAGFGDPTLSGEPVSKTLPTMDKRSFDLARITRSGGPVRSVAEMAELPGTARELEAMRQSLGAGEDSIVLGDFATEQAVHNADLSQVDVLHFATHGLLPGEMAGLLEAALVFTPVENPASRQNDALLRATEIAGMNLNADWVILSACNTATTGGETGSYASFGGLPEAFFYAGADTLLASHWPVLDDVAELISVRTIELARQDEGLSRGQALQQAMREIRRDPANPGWAHPSAWAPMVVIGMD